MKKYYVYVLSFYMIASSFIFSSCASLSSSEISLSKSISQSAPKERITKNFQLLGTVVTLSAYGGSGEEAILAAKEKAIAIENLMSTTISSSEVSILNHAPLNEVTPLSKDTSFVLSKALEYAVLTKGAFDPAIGHLVDLWGIGTDHARVPSSSEIEPYIQNVLYPFITFSSEGASLSSSLAKVDLGGIAKGYAGDEMKKVLVEEYGIESAFLNLGGNVVTIGTKPDGSDWAVGLQDPFAAHRGDTVGIIRAANRSIVSSGSYERNFTENGTLYHHILDPQTGLPAQSDLASSTIIASDGTLADALSTATYILGKEEGLLLIESLEDVEGIFITQDKKIFTTSGIDSNFFTLTNEDFTYEKTN